RRRRERLPVRLGEERRGGRRGGEGEERRLLEEARPAALERPEVEEEQEQGSRDEHRLGEEAQREERRDREITPRPSPPGPRDIRGGGQEKEQRAQDALALGDPGDALDVQRVHGEERGHGGARPESGRRGAEEQEEEDGARRVEGRVDEVG